MTLIEMNVVAARRFYQLAVGHLPPSSTVRFILALHQTLKCCVEEGERGGPEGESRKRKRHGKVEGEEKEPHDGARNHTTEGEDFQWSLLTAA